MWRMVLLADAARAVQLQSRVVQRQWSWGEIHMRKLILMTCVTSMAALSSADLQAQQATSPNLDAIPEKMPFSTPYGAPIGAQRAQLLVQTAADEATKKGWSMDIAVVDAGANLVAFLRMDGALLASISVAQHKARSAVQFRRPTKAFEDAVQKADLKYVLSVDDVIASRGGIPLIEDGKIIGAIGCSSGTGSQDEMICAAAAALIHK
jgi:glc operon protein GlcG